MATKGIHLPGLGLAHPPQLDLTIVGGTCQQGQGGMKRGPVNSTFVSFQYILYNNIVGTEQLGLYVHGSGRSGGRTSSSAIAVMVSIHHAGESSSIKSTNSSSQVLLPKSGSVPHTNSLIQTGTHNKILGGMKGRTHDIMIVPRQYAQTAAFVEVPQAQRLVIARG